MIKRLMLGGGLSIGAIAPLARATPTIVVGDHVLAPGVPGQTVLINVSGGDPVMATDVTAQVADGGPSVGGAVVGPFFGARPDLITGTIFAGNNTGQQDQYPNATSTPSTYGPGLQDYAGAVITNSGSVPASGLLATYFFDSTGIASGVYPLLMSNIQHGNQTGTTDFGLTPANITNGNLIVSIPGDLNLDGTVNFSDVLSLIQHYGSTQTPGSLTGYQNGDIDHNGTIAFPDVLTLIQNYGHSININPPPPAALGALAAAAVPEPAVLGLGALGAGLLLRRSRR